MGRGLYHCQVTLKPTNPRSHCFFHTPPHEQHHKRHKNRRFDGWEWMMCTSLTGYITYSWKFQMALQAARDHVFVCVWNIRFRMKNIYQIKEHHLYYLHCFVAKRMLVVAFTWCTKTMVMDWAVFVLYERKRISHTLCFLGAVLPCASVYLHPDLHSEIYKHCNALKLAVDNCSP